MRLADPEGAATHKGLFTISPWGQLLSREPKIAEVSSMLAEVRRCLEEHQEKYRRSGLPALELRGMYALFPEEGLADFVESRWDDPYPNAQRKGWRRPLPSEVCASLPKGL